MKKRIKGKIKKTDFIDELSSMLPSDRAKRARDDANKEIFLIQLADLRKKMGIKQDEIKSFTQSGVSKLEARKDIKISTLLDYLDDIGLGIEIKVFPKRRMQKKQFKDKIVLLKS